MLQGRGILQGRVCRTTAEPVGHMGMPSYRAGYAYMLAPHETVRGREALLVLLARKPHAVHVPAAPRGTETS